jgi:hypothetical protein
MKFIGSVINTNTLLSNGAFSNQLKALRLIDTEEKKNFLMENLI